MAKRVEKEIQGEKTRLVADGQPRGFAGPSDIELDGNVIGQRSGFNHATGREKQSVGDWGLRQLNGKRAQS